MSITTYFYFFGLASRSAAVFEIEDVGTAALEIEKHMLPVVGH